GRTPRDRRAAGGWRLPRLRRGESHVHGLLLAVALEREAHDVARLMRPDARAKLYRVAHRRAVAGDDLVADGLREVDRDEEPVPRVVTGLGDDRVGDAEHAALAVGNRTARVARVD